MLYDTPLYARMYIHAIWHTLDKGLAAFMDGGGSVIRLGGRKAKSRKDSSAWDSVSKDNSKYQIHICIQRTGVVEEKQFLLEVEEAQTLSGVKQKGSNLYLKKFKWYF